MVEVSHDGGTRDGEPSPLRRGQDGTGEGPHSLRWLAGHVAVGLVVLVVIAVLVPLAGAVLYPLLLVAAVPFDHRWALQPRRARGFAARFGWALLLPFYVLGLALHLLMELGSVFA